MHLLKYARKDAVRCQKVPKNGCARSTKWLYSTKNASKCPPILSQLTQETAEREQHHFVPFRHACRPHLVSKEAFCGAYKLIST